MDTLGGEGHGGLLTRLRDKALAVFAEVMLIAMRSNRKFLVYDWDTLRSYFYLPFQFEVITEKGTRTALLFCSLGARPRHVNRRKDQPMPV